MPALGLFVLTLLAAPAADGQPKSPVGNSVKAFELNDHLGTPHKLAQRADKKAVVVVFLGVECPLAKLYGARLAELAATYEPKGVAFVAINSNQQDSLAEIEHYAREHKIAFPILKDPGNAVADRFGARRTPEAFVLDAKHAVRYWGRIDDQYGVGYSRSSATQNSLAEALDELLAGKEVSRPAVEPVGCFIGRVERKPATGDVTYSKHVASILHRHCVACHRPGQVAPFALTSFDDARSWAETIEEVISEGRMPPWHANPEHGKFVNDIRLSKEDKQLVAMWVRNGCPLGDPKHLPELPAFVEGWQIPKPDIVYKAEKPIAVPARGVVPYQHMVIDPGFTEDKWIQAAEARPGNRAVTHHLVAFFHPPGKDKWNEGDALFNSIVGFAPGMPPAIYPPGTCRKIPAGSKLVIQAHYTPNGTPQQDQSELGLVFADAKTVKREMTVSAALNWQFFIPPGAKDHRVEATLIVDQDRLLYAVTPHMHLRGKSFRFQAIYPDGQEEILLDVPRYDFNWQNTYSFAAPKRLPEGTQVRCTATYDNSADNLANPDPKRPVTWGDQTWEEMMVGYMSVSLAEQDLSLGVPKSKRLDDGRYEVTFTYRPEGKVEAVYLAGTFNEWQPTGHRMDGPDKQGRYTTRIKLDAGEHEYKFVLDGTRWKTDPGNPTQVGFYKNSHIRLGEGK